MEVRLPPDQKAFIRQALESGRFHDPEEAVQEALSLWEGRERKRLQECRKMNVLAVELGTGYTELHVPES